MCLRSHWERRQGTLGILQCGPNQHWILQKAELDTRVCNQEVYLGSFIPRNRIGILERGIGGKYGIRLNRTMGNWVSILQGAL